MIYFLIRKSDGAIKAGFSDDPATRFRQLQAEHGDIELLGIMNGGREAEAKIHRLFDPYRLDGSKSKEWFSDNPGIRQFIRLNCCTEMPETRTTTIRVSVRTAQLVALGAAIKGLSGDAVSADDYLLWLIGIGDPETMRIAAERRAS